MIIQCTNCKKSFKVDSELIPSAGRNIQCGLCNHTWFYKYNDIPSSIEAQNLKEGKNVKFFDEANNKKVNVDKYININKDSGKDEIHLSKKIENENSSKPEEKNIFKLSKVLSYILVSIVSGIAVIIFLDTFKSVLTNIFPNLELLLYNLFESLKDMFLFIKNLLK